MCSCSVLPFIIGQLHPRYTGFRPGLERLIEIGELSLQTVVFFLHIRPLKSPGLKFFVG